MPRSPRYPFPITLADLDTQRRIPLSVIYRCLQDAADNHATFLGFDSVTLLHRNLTWILSRVHVRMTSTLTERQVIEVETWPSKLESRIAHRDYRVFREGEPEPVGVATSAWILIDIVRKRPAVLTDMFPSGYHQGLDEGNEMVPPSVMQTQEVVITRAFPARRVDLDLNDHVNNLPLVEWVVESVPDEVWQASALRELYVEFKKPVRYGETATVFTSSIIGEGFTHRMSSDGQEGDILRAFTRWSRG
jgi:medium-chain acyl-[acyl-carrier-protein] hydrolase